jgi:hypothetical protein
MTRWIAIVCLAGAVAVLASGLGLGVPAAGAQGPGAGSTPCPVPVDQFRPLPGANIEGIAVCVDRGDGATYTAGDPITLCVTVSLPTIMIYPPPPPPPVRVMNSTDGGPPRTVLADAFNGDSRCITGEIEPPLGRDVFRAEVLDPNGAPIAASQVQIISQPR